MCKFKSSRFLISLELFLKVIPPSRAASRLVILFPPRRAALRSSSCPLYVLIFMIKTFSITRTIKESIMNKYRRSIRVLLNYYNHDQNEKLQVYRNEGLFAPLTASGTLIVDGVVASSYSDLRVSESTSLPLPHALAQAILSPLRWAGAATAMLSDTRSTSVSTAASVATPIVSI